MNSLGLRSFAALRMTGVALRMTDSVKSRRGRFIAPIADLSAMGAINRPLQWMSALFCQSALSAPIPGSHFKYYLTTRLRVARRASVVAGPRGRDAFQADRPLLNTAAGASYHTCCHKHHCQGSKEPWEEGL